MGEMDLRQMTPEDASEVAELIYTSINVWYATTGIRDPVRGRAGRHRGLLRDLRRARARSDGGRGQPGERADHGLVLLPPAPDPRRARNHERAPNYFGRGVAKALCSTSATTRTPTGMRRCVSRRAVSTSIRSRSTRDSDSSRGSRIRTCGCRFPRRSGCVRPGRDRVRPATPADAPAMEALELEVSACRAAPTTRTRSRTRRASGARRCWRPLGGIDGYAIASGHAAMNIVGPLVARTDEDALALVAHALDLYPGRTPLVIVPSERRAIVEQMYGWGGRISELHFCQVRGAFQPFRGVSMPTSCSRSAEGDRPRRAVSRSAGPATRSSHRDRRCRRSGPRLG